MRYLARILIILAVLSLTAAFVLAQDGDGEGEAEPTGEVETEPAGETTFDLPITNNVTYTVRAGDNLDGIAAMFDVRLACLRETNGLVPADIIRPGDQLTISVECPAYDGAQEVQFPRTDAPGRTGEDGIYVVRPGDTLDTIGQELDVSVESLRVANDLESSRIMPGQELAIPEDAPPYGVFPALSAPEAGGGVAGETYVIQPRDMLDSIGQAFNVSVVSLMVVNEIDNPRLIQPGQTIIIPEDAPPYGEFPALDAPEAGGGVAGQTYVVQPREWLDGIAADFNVDTHCLIEANMITNTRLLQPGQTLVIPNDCPEYRGADVVGEGARPRQPGAGGGGDTGEEEEPPVEAPPTGEG